jgi:hypothetical protein
MDSNYELFYVGLKGLTNQQVIDEIYKKVGEYCQLIQEDIPNTTELFKEKLRVLFDKVALLRPEKMFQYIG